MKQLTKKQAIAVMNSKVWKKWDNEQIVRFQLFQDRICLPFSKFHEAIEKVLNRPVYIDEFGMNYDGIAQEYLGTKEPPTMEEIMNLIPEDKRMLISL